MLHVEKAIMDPIKGIAVVYPCVGKKYFKAMSACAEAQLPQEEMIERLSKATAKILPGLAHMHKKIMRRPRVAGGGGQVPLTKLICNC
jgi:hypothetical protein